MPARAWGNHKGSPYKFTVSIRMSLGRRGPQGPAYALFIVVGVGVLIAHLALAPVAVEPRGVHPSEAAEQSKVTLHGTLTRQDYEQVIERTFDVPAGTARIAVELSYTGKEQRTVIDLGLRGPNGLRGWSGGARSTFSVGRLTATAGYLPGALEPGSWAVLLGVPNIREGVTAEYTISVTLDPDERVSTKLSSESRWYVGDLHAHSGHSDGVMASQRGNRVPAAVHLVAEAAAAAGLDFVALTDHNTASHWLELERLQPGYEQLLLIRGREVTTYRGHANSFGERAFTDFRLMPHRPMRTLLRDVKSGGAFVSINHPTRPDDETCMGCGWNDVDRDTLQLVDGVEVVNGDQRAGEFFGWRFWADALNRGHRLTAIGGSDDHAPGSAVERPFDPTQGKQARIGTPATLVHAAALSEDAILEGLRSGRVYVRATGPQGPTLDFRGHVSSGEIAMGGMLPTGPAELAVTLDGARGLTLVWIKNGVELGREPIAADHVVQRRDVRVEAGDWFSVLVNDTKGAVLVSNAIYGPAR